MVYATGVRMEAGVERGWKDEGKDELSHTDGKQSAVHDSDALNRSGPDRYSYGETVERRLLLFGGNKQQLVLLCRPWASAVGCSCRGQPRPLQILTQRGGRLQTSRDKAQLWKEGPERKVKISSDLLGEIEEGHSSGNVPNVAALMQSFWPPSLRPCLHVKK